MGVVRLCFLLLAAGRDSLEPEAAAWCVFRGTDAPQREAEEGAWTMSAEAAAW